jgi:hypothetical protein
VGAINGDMMFDEFVLRCSSSSWRNGGSERATPYGI